MSEQKMDAERAAFEAAYAEAVDSGWTSTKSLAQTIWRKARSLPVGVPGTPGARWRANGEPDPHGDRYNCERIALSMGDLTDDELADGAFMNYDRPRNIEGVLAGTHRSLLAWMTAVKDRIRWLSRKLDEALAATPAQSVGVPDGAQFKARVLELIGDECKYWQGRDEARRGGFANLYAKVNELATPTVKAEQVQRCAPTELALLREYRMSGIAFNDAQGEGYTVEQSNRAEQRMEAAEKACWDFYAGRKPGPSLPAAGSAVEEVEVVAYGSSKGIHPVPARCAIGSSGALLESYDTPLMTVAQHERIVAALSAQQSAPERVSVPVELAERLIDPYRREPRSIHLHNEDCDQLRALLNGGGV